MMKFFSLLFLTSLMAIGFSLTSSSAFANEGNQILSDLANGQKTLSQAASTLSQKANIPLGSADNLIRGIISGDKIDIESGGQLLDGFIGNDSPLKVADIGNITNMIQGLQNGQGATDAIKSLTSKLGSGELSSEIGKALGSIEDLGNISNISDITNIIKNPSISNVLGSVLPDTATKALETVSSISNIASVISDPKSLLQNPGAIVDLTKSVVSVLPSQLQDTLGDLLGGSDAVEQLLGGALSDTLSDALGGGITDGLLPGDFDGGAGSGNAENTGGGKYETFKRDPKAQATNECSFSCTTYCTCKEPIENNHIKIRAHMTDEFIKHRNWMIDELFTKHILPAMAQMTSQLSTIAMQHTYIVGRFFDAKHQLETQRLFQELMAEAHKDYQPSEGLCEIGTNIRSLATSSRKSDLSHVAFANRVMARQLNSGDVLTTAESNADIYSRINMFTQNHCNKKDNANGLNRLCKNGGNNKERMNKDVDFTRTIEGKLTLDADFTKEGENKTAPDAQDVFALTSNLFAHNPLPQIPRAVLATKEGIPREASYRYLDLRSVAAKRSVAQNAVTAMIAERTKGDKEVAQYLKKLIEELGIKEEDVEDVLGEQPSYFAQMEVLTKNIYQNPVFYTELYDKPANILRKGTAIRAINLMQERDLYKSQLRKEAVLAVLLETMLQEEHNRVTGQLNNLEAGGR